MQLATLSLSAISRHVPHAMHHAHHFAGLAVIAVDGWEHGVSLYGAVCFVSLVIEAAYNFAIDR